MRSPYASGNDVTLEFLGHCLTFSADDFGERVVAAAVKLGLVLSSDLDEGETDDLVEVVATGLTGAPRSGLGAYLARNWEQIAVREGESLVYWLRKLVFRGAYLDQRVKDGVLGVAFDERSGDHAYEEPGGGRTALEAAPVPSWRAVRFRG
ncbi:MAG: hypothetical protein EXQ77_01470 [Thermoleophilia bacterium]|nr:hypothetical protein [Thermoleophilia bacterium]